MSILIDFDIASSMQIEAALCTQLENLRLSRNITQAQLAKEAGLGVRTIKRLENGQGITLDTFIRILIALKIQNNLQSLLPDPAIRPIERVTFNGKERKRARPKKSNEEKLPWTWGDESGEKR
jgi:transcriptional regulator with XRE-family HTH domain